MSLYNLQKFLREDHQSIHWKQMVRENRMIDAIKSLRVRYEDMYGEKPGLKDFKDIVEAYAAEYKLTCPLHTATLHNGKLCIYMNPQGTFRIETTVINNGLSLQEAFSFLNDALRNDSIRP